MPGEILVFFIANIFFNSIIAFGISALTVELFIFIIRMNKRKMFKTMYYMRMLPFIKIIYDVIFNFNTSTWAVGNGIDIINRVPNSMMLHMGAGLIKPFIPLFYWFDISIYKQYTVSITDLITQSIGFYYTLIIVVSILTVSLFFILFNSIKLIYSMLTTKILFSGSHLSRRVINNNELAKKIKRMNIEIRVSPEEGFSPFSYGTINPRIIIPENFYKKLNPKEFEALIIHEMGHIGWWNSITQLLMLFMKSFFWFIPFIHSYVQNINTTRELACDKSCIDYNCNSVILCGSFKKSRFLCKVPGILMRIPSLF